MKVRPVLLTLASATLGALLIALLIRIGKIDLRSTYDQVVGVSRVVFAKLVLLNILLAYLSTEKWMRVDAALRNASDPVPSKASSFAVTSGGMALGLVLPIQLGMSAARTLGTYAYGSAFKRGAAGTLIEQSFDLLIVTFLAVASGITWLFGGRGPMWILSAVAMVALAFLAAETLPRLSGWLASIAANIAARQGWAAAALNRLSAFLTSGALSARLTRKLVILSAARFGVVALMAGVTAEAIGAPIPLWKIAAAVPFAFLVSIIGVTPGGLGVNEITSTAVLGLFGTPFSIGAKWALANRVLGVASCFVVAMLAATLIGVKRALAACYSDKRLPLETLSCEHEVRPGGTGRKT